MIGFTRFLTGSAVLFSGVATWHVPAMAGLDLENQTQIPIGALDLDRDGRIMREEATKYLFYYFDHDGNEVLTKGEYHRERPLEVLPYEGEAISFIDLDGDGEDDGVETYTDKQAFMAAIVIGDEYDPTDEGIEAYHVLDIYYGRLDSDKSKAIELKEWQRHFTKHAAKKPNMPPKSADHRRYAQ